jgi:chemotaxis protein methyltransferase CheR
VTRLPSDQPDVEEIELSLLLEAVQRRYGHELRHWDAARVRDRVTNLVAEGQFSSISALQAMVLREESWLERLMSGIWSQPGRGMFADPPFWRALRWKILPVLRTWPTIRAWVAGCATGGDAWSLGVLFEEEGLGRRAVVHATDLDDAMLRVARESAAGPENVASWEANYRLSGGLRSLGSYFDEEGGISTLRPEVRDRIAYSRHVPGIEPSFNEFQLILFRNPFVWADSGARQRVGALLRESQVTFGFLCLDEPETLQCLPRGVWSLVDRKLAIARRVA